MLNSLMSFFGVGSGSARNAVRIDWHAEDTDDIPSCAAKTTNKQRNQIAQRLIEASENRDEDPEEYERARAVFEGMSGLRNGDLVPNWLKHNYCGKYASRRKYHEQKTHNMASPHKAKKKLLSETDGYCYLSGDVLEDNCELEHIVPMTECRCFYIEGEFRMIRPDGGDWHSWDNLCLVNKEAHKHKSRLEGHYG